MAWVQLAVPEWLFPIFFQLWAWRLFLLHNWYYHRDSEQIYPLRTQSIKTMDQDSARRIDLGYVRDCAKAGSTSFPRIWAVFFHKATFSSRNDSNSTGRANLKVRITIDIVISLSNWEHDRSSQKESSRLSAEKRRFLEKETTASEDDEYQKILTSETIWCHR
jgi:hypothetical protein